MTKAPNFNQHTSHVRQLNAPSIKAGEIADRLAQQVETVATYLLPNGKRNGSCWVAGSIHGDEGKSLKVVLSGDKAGRWMDHADKQHHGDLLNLWEATRGLSTAEAIREAKDYLGIHKVVKASPTSLKRTVERKTVAPEPQAGVTALKPDGDVYRCLVEERKLQPEVLKRFRVAEKNGNVIVFPYLDPDQNRVLIKYLALDRSDGKKIWTSKASEKILFGWQAVDLNSRTVVITEGEIDAITLAGFGIPALSIPYGAGKQPQSEWIENDRDLMDRFDEIIIWMDNDEAGHETAQEIARQLGPDRCRLAFASHDCNDPNEMLQMGCEETDFRACLDTAKPTKAEVLLKAEAANVIGELAQLSNIAYEQCRVDTAKEMGVRVSVLDAEVEKLRPKAPVEEDDHFPTPEPWADPVVLADLLDEIVVVIHRHIILGKPSAIAIALYVLLTYCVDEISCCTTLAIESPEKRCGKTTLLDLLMRLVYRPIPAANISPAAVYRLIEAMQPTLLIDEADTFLRANDDIRGILNSGHTRATAVVWRTEEISGERVVVPFSTWGAKVIAQIGQLYETLRDRSIVVPMRRKLPDEKVERLRKRDYSHIPRKAYTWALENKARIPALEPEAPECLNDRQADGWEPLFAIADIAGGEWPDKARSAAKSASGGESEGEGIRIQLLTDLCVIFQEDNQIGWGTTDLIQKLCERFEDHPWPTYSKGNRITPRQLAALLKPFGIKSKVERSLGSKRGYMTEAFNDPFKRYLPLAVTDTPSPPGPPSVCVTPLQPLHSNGLIDFPSVTAEDRVTHEEPLKTVPPLGCNTVTDGKGGVEGEHIQNDESGVTDDAWEF